MKALRAAFCAHQPTLDPDRTFFIDETGSTVAMSRTHGRSPAGVPVSGTVPRNYGDVITIIGALGVQGLVATMTVRGSTTKAVFRAYVRDVLLPELRPGDTVVFDNLAAHKDSVALELFKDHGVRVVFQPPYSPDLNPIELAWAWLKWWLRVAKARTDQGVNNAISMAMELITPEMARGWIRHCGYGCQPS